MKKRLFRTIKIFVIITAILLPGFVFAQTVGTIDATDKWAWGENIGWLNWGTGEGNVQITAAQLTGYVWGENVGWISLNCSNTGSCGTVDYGVDNDGNGNLSGYAWGENIGWLSFNCSNTGSCGTVDYGVVINAYGEFTGYAWGENVGWINFNCANNSSCGTVNFLVETSWEPSTGAVVIPPVIPSIPTPAPTPIPSPTVAVVPSASPTVPPESPTPPVEPSAEPSIEPSPTESATPLPSPPGATPTTPPPSSTPFPGIPSEIVETINNILNNLGNILRDIGRIPYSREVAGVLALAGTLAGVLSTLASVVNTLRFASELPLLGQHVFVSLFELVGLRKRRQSWGTVYNSITKEPLPLAKVSLLMTDGRLVESRVTDRYGRYGFLVAEELRGSDFVIRVDKKEYSYPSRRIVTPTDTILYQHVYHGEVINIQSGAITNFDIPMDPLALESEVLAGGNVLMLKFSNVVIRFLDILFWISLVTLPLSVYFQPSTFNIIMLGVFLLFALIRLTDYHEKPYGMVLDTAGQTIPYSLMILNDHMGQRKGFAVSDKYGRYFMLADKGNYTMLKSTPAQVIPGRQSEEQISTKNGWIKKKVVL